MSAYSKSQFQTRNLQALWKLDFEIFSQSKNFTFPSIYAVSEKIVPTWVCCRVTLICLKSCQQSAAHFKTQNIHFPTSKFCYIKNSFFFAMYWLFGSGSEVVNLLSGRMKVFWVVAQLAPTAYPIPKKQEVVLSKEAMSRSPHFFFVRSILQQ